MTHIPVSPTVVLGHLFTLLRVPYVGGVIHGYFFKGLPGHTLWFTHEAPVLTW